MNVPMKRPDWGEFGPCMKNLANDQQREFVYLLVHASPARGALVQAYRDAGYGQGSTPAIQARAAWKLSHDERVIAAIAEESRKIIRVAFPEGANALLNLIRDPDHKEHGRALGLLMERVFPAETKHSVEVVHKTVDPDLEALEEVRALRHLGTERPKLLELFGHNGLDRLEVLEASDNARRAEQAKVIDAEATEVAPHVQSHVSELDPEMREDDF